MALAIQGVADRPTRPKPFLNASRLQRINFPYRCISGAWLSGTSTGWRQHRQLHSWTLRHARESGSRRCAL